MTCDLQSRKTPLIHWLRRTEVPAQLSVDKTGNAGRIAARVASVRRDDPIGQYFQQSALLTCQVVIGRNKTAGATTEYRVSGYHNAAQNGAGFQKPTASNGCNARDAVWPVYDR